jgi:hypothetical protein
MFWWFERGEEIIRLEVLQLSDGFELRVIEADGSETTETFSNSGDLAKRHAQVQDQVRKHGWNGPRGPLM